MIKFVLLVNKQGQTRLAKYFDEAITAEERRVLEGEVVRKCLARTDKQVTNQVQMLLACIHSIS
jgi:AP-4 complex subunit sigma-1